MSRSMVYWWNFRTDSLSVFEHFFGAGKEGFMIYWFLDFDIEDWRAAFMVCQVRDTAGILMQTFKASSQFWDERSFPSFIPDSF